MTDGPIRERGAVVVEVVARVRSITGILSQMRCGLPFCWRVRGRLQTNDGEQRCCGSAVRRGLGV